MLKHEMSKIISKGKNLKTLFFFFYGLKLGVSIYRFCGRIDVTGMQLVKVLKSHQKD